MVWKDYNRSKHNIHWYLTSEEWNKKISQTCYWVYWLFSESAHVVKWAYQKVFTEYVVKLRMCRYRYFTFMLRHFSTEMKCDFVGVFSFLVFETGYFFFLPIMSPPNIEVKSAMQPLQTVDKTTVERKWIRRQMLQK